MIIAVGALTITPRQRYADAMGFENGLEFACDDRMNTAKWCGHADDCGCGAQDFSPKCELGGCDRPRGHGDKHTRHYVAADGAMHAITWNNAGPDAVRPRKLPVREHHAH